MKKILYILTQSDFGGAQRYVCTLARHLQNKKWDVHVAAGGNGILFDKLSKNNISTHHVKHLTRAINPMYDYLAYREIKKIIEKIKPDVVHLNSSKVGVIGSFAAKHLLVKNIIYTAHGFVFNEPIFHTLQWLYKKAERSNAKRVHHIITVSKNDEITGIKAGIPQEKITTIYNAIDTEDYTFLSKQQAQEELSSIAQKACNKPINPQTKIVGTIANFYTTKGLDVLLKAVQKIPHIQVVIIGDGPERTYLEKIMRSLDLSQKVFLIGNVEKASQFLKAFDVFVLSSRKEGLPYVLLEASAANVPIVATRVGGIPEMITHDMNGYLAPKDNPQYLGKMIQKALQKPRNPIVHGFEFKEMMHKTISLYSD